MRKVATILITLSLVAIFIIYGKAFAQEDMGDTQESVKTPETSETTEATIPYSAPYNSPDTGANEVEVAEDSE